MSAKFDFDKIFDKNLNTYINVVNVYISSLASMCRLVTLMEA